MNETPYYPADECLPIFDLKDGIIHDVVLRKRAHAEWLCHGHVNVWIPWEKRGTAIVQVKTKSHGKRDATIGGHIDCAPDALPELRGRNIVELAPRTAVKEWGEESGMIFTEKDIIPLWSMSEFHDAPHPVSKAWNNGIVIAYVLNRRIALAEILGNTTRESGLSFEEVSIETLLGLSEKDSNKYLHKLIGEPYKGILLALREQMKQI